MEAEILDAGNKTSRIELKRSNYGEAIASQRREVHIQFSGAAPRFVWELVPQKIMDGANVKFVCKVCVSTFSLKNSNI